MAKPWEQQYEKPDASHPTVNVDVPGSAPATKKPWEMFSTPSVPVQGTGAGNSDTSIPGEFMNTAAEHVANFFPNVGSTIAGLATHPLDTGANMVRNLIHTPKDIYTDLSGGHVGRGLENLTELAAPFALKGAGKLLQSGAEPMAEIAGRVNKFDRAFGANPGRAVIQETSSPTISGTARQLGEKSANLSNQLVKAAKDASNRGAMGDLLPARAAVEGPLENATRAGATSTSKELQDMKSFLQGRAPQGFGGTTLPGPAGPPAPPITSAVLGPNGQPIIIHPGMPGPRGPALISPFQDPEQLLRMRQEFPANFQVKYGGNAPGKIEEVGRQVNHALSDQVKRTVPEAVDLDSRVQNLIAAKRPFESTSQNAGLGQRLAGRMTAHTGALVGGAAGYATHGVPGAIAGFALPEVLGSPTVQLNLARGMDLFGRGLQTPKLTVPLTLGAKSTQQQ